MRPCLRDATLAWTVLAAVAVATVAAFPSAAPAQGTRRPIVSDSRVGYIDPAIPGSLFRLRYDTAYDFRRAARAEFFYARSGPAGPGLPRPEPSVDYQDVTAYLEVAAGERFSGFVELPGRFLNPQVNDNTAGLGDVSAGFKFAFIADEDRIATFQLRSYAPSGDAERGLGTRHVSLEPALLFYQRLDERCGLEGELRWWIPIEGTSFAGDIIRYGLGLHYDLLRRDELVISPVAELVGWTVLGGKESAVRPGGPPLIEDAAGDTILNVKVGLRLKFGAGDIYTGYGRPLTGDRWYENVFRVEFRLLF